MDKLIQQTRPLMVPAVLLSAVGLGYFRGPGSFVLVLAGSALLLAVFSLWNSVRLLVGDLPVDVEAAVALGQGTDEAEKRRILGALNDLKQERQLGKLSEEDYDALSEQYRAEAKELLKRTDERLLPARLKAEELLETRLKAREIASKDLPKAKEDSDADNS